MEGKGNDSLLKTSKITEWNFNNGGYISLLFGGFLIAGCVFAYIIAIARGNVEPFLPLISDAAGSPPQNGIFGTLIAIGGMIGVIFMLLRYMIVMEKNQEKSKMVVALNKCSLIIGIISMCAITLITGYPVNFYRNKDTWLYDVGIPHMIGGIIFFSFGIIYVAIQSIITLFQHSKDRATLLVRLLICAGCCITFVYHIVTVPDHFGGLSHLYYKNTSDIEIDNVNNLLPYPETLGSSLKLPIDTSGTYLASAITEWLLVFLLCAFFFTFFNEAQEYSLLVVVETQCPNVENLHEVTGDSVSKSPNVNGDSQRSEVKTVFRRDSSCQTKDDPTVSMKPNSGPFEKGKYTKRQISSFDMLSGDKLEKLIESHVKKNKRDDKNRNGDLKTNNFKNSTSLKEEEEEEEEESSDADNKGTVKQNGVSNDVSKTCSGIIEGTTDRGC